MANRQTIASKKYHEKIGVKLKSFQLPIELIEKFKIYCEKNNISQSKQIKELMLSCVNDKLGNNLLYKTGYKDCELEYKERDKKLLEAYTPVYEQEIILNKIDFAEIVNAKINNKELKTQVIKNLFGHNIKTLRKNITVLRLNTFFKIITDTKYKDIYDLDNIKDRDNELSILDQIRTFYIDLAIKDIINKS